MDGGPEGLHEAPFEDFGISRVGPAPEALVRVCFAEVEVVARRRALVSMRQTDHSRLNMARSPSASGAALDLEGVEPKGIPCIGGLQTTHPHLSVDSSQVRTRSGYRE